LPGAWSDARHVIGLHLESWMRTGWSKFQTHFVSFLPFPSLPSLPSPHTSQVHTHGIRAAGDPSSAAGAPVSKRRLSKHHRSCPPIRVWYQSMTSAPAVAQQWWRAGGDAAHPGQVRLLEFLLSIIILMILIILIIITAPFAPSCCVRRYAWLAPCRPNATRSRHAGPHSHLRSERASE
jgi:hypothetical protein